MTHSESIQRAYRWAFEAYHNKKSKLLVLLCAKQVLCAIEDSQQDNDVAYSALFELIREWVSKRKDGLARPVKVLAGILDVKADELEPLTTDEIA